MCSMRQVRDRHGDRKLITDHVKDSVKSVLIFYYVGNIVLDISGISTEFHMIIHGEAAFVL